MGNTCERKGKRGFELVLELVNGVIRTTSRVVLRLIIIASWVETTEYYSLNSGNDNIKQMKIEQGFNTYTSSNFIIAHHKKASRLQQ